MEWTLLAFTAYRRACGHKWLVAGCTAGLLALGAAGTPAVLAQHQGCRLTATAIHPSLVDHIQVFQETNVDADTGLMSSRMVANGMMPTAGAVTFTLPCGEYTVVPFPSEKDLTEAWEALPMPLQVHLERDRRVSVDP